MEMPITEKEYEFIMEAVKHNTQLYNKLWTHWFHLKHRKEK